MVFKGFSTVCAPQASNLHDVFDSTTSEEIQNAVWNSQLRTQVIYGIHNTKVKDIRMSLIKQSCANLNTPVGEVVEDIWQDTLDKARFYIRYDTVEHRRLVAANGFTITNRLRTVIVRKQQLFMGRIENVSPLFTLDIMKILLSKYGDLHEIRFETYAHSTISRRKLLFSYSTIHTNKKIPRSIELDGVQMQIIDQTSLLQCHWSNKCIERNSAVDSNSENDREKHDGVQRSPTPSKGRSDEVQDEEWPLPKLKGSKLTVSDIDPVTHNIASCCETPMLCTQIHEQTRADLTTLCAQDKLPDPQGDVSLSVREERESPDTEFTSEDDNSDGSDENERVDEKNDLMEFFKVWDEEIGPESWKHINSYTLKKYVEKSLMFGTS